MIITINFLGGKMNKLLKMLVLITVITLFLLLSSGCGKNSVTGIYNREFGDYSSSTMYVELKNDMTYKSGEPKLGSEGTYEINGSVITFTLTTRYLLFPGEPGDMITGTIANGVIKVGDTTYKK